jgi:hypothetical protein
MRTRLLVIAAAAAVVVVAVAVTLVVVDRDPPDATRPDLAATGVPNFPARGPSAGDDALLRRAVDAWRWTDGPTYLLWAGPRPGGAVVVLARGRRESPRIAIYDDRARAVIREAPGVGSDAMILGGGGRTNPWYSIGFGDGTALRFTGPAASASPSPGVSNCGPAPACLKAQRVGLPMLLAGWLYRGPGSPRVLVVVGGPEVVRIHVRVGTLTRDLPAGAARLTAADLGVPAAPDDATGGDGPAVVVYGDLADGTAVPALTGTA